MRGAPYKSTPSSISRPSFRLRARIIQWLLHSANVRIHVYWWCLLVLTHCNSQPVVYKAPFTTSYVMEDKDQRIEETKRRREATLIVPYDAALELSQQINKHANLEVRRVCCKTTEIKVRFLFCSICNSLELSWEAQRNRLKSAAVKWLLLTVLPNSI